jgi:hypothetical protein
MAKDPGATARGIVETALLARGYRGEQIARLIQQLQQQPMLTKQAPAPAQLTATTKQED